MLSILTLEGQGRHSMGETVLATLMAAWVTIIGLLGGMQLRSIAEKVGV